MVRFAGPQLLNCWAITLSPSSAILGNKVGVGDGLGVGVVVAVTVASAKASTTGVNVAGSISEICLETVGDGVEVGRSSRTSIGRVCAGVINGAGRAVGYGVDMKLTTSSGMRRRICSGIKLTGSGKIHQVAEQRATTIILPIAITNKCLRQVISSFYCKLRGLDHIFHNVLLRESF